MRDRELRDVVKLEDNWRIENPPIPPALCAPVPNGKLASAAILPTRSLLPLAPFAHNWVGGDIDGLAAFTGTLYRYMPAMQDVVTALDKKVGQIVTDAGWQGTAAQASASSPTGWTTPACSPRRSTSPWLTFSPVLAYPLETYITVGSIVLATAVGGAVAGAAIFAGAPVLGVAAGVAAGAVVAYGVGDYDHNYIADFGQQWHEHGALGIVTDYGAAGVRTWDDTTHLASDVASVASSAWHGIASLF
jgi:hypothetical protein